MRARRFPWRRIAARCGIAVVIVVGVLALHQAVTWPDVDAVVEGPVTSSAFIEAHERRSGEAARRVWVSYQQISDELKLAVLVAEDIRFFDHEGFDSHEQRVAIQDWLRGERSLRGASTISQQLVKNLWLSPSRNPWRKVKEALLVRQLERKLEKRRILELYLNVAEMGSGLYGAEAAARHYFSRSASRLNRRQAAQLAASLSRPSRWFPGSESSGYERRARLIEGRMRAADWLRRLL